MPDFEIGPTQGLSSSRASEAFPEGAHTPSRISVINLYIVLHYLTTNHAILSKLLGIWRRFREAQQREV
jgi:hypothetical protein